MERYNIAYVGADEHTTRLVVPFRPTAQFADLTAELARRLSRHSVSVDKADMQLRFGDRNGPFLDESDTLEDVIVNPREEIVYVVARSQQSSSANDSSADNAATTVPENTQPLEHTLMEGEAAIKIRVITPEHARRRNDLASLPLVPGHFSKKSTLREIRQRVARCLGVTLEDNQGLHPDLKECNCSLARAISEGKLYKIDQLQEDPNAGHSFLFIHSKSVVEVGRAPCLEKIAVRAKVKERIASLFGVSNSSNKSLNIFGGELAGQSDTYVSIHSRLKRGVANHRDSSSNTHSPIVVAVCSASRHVAETNAAPGLSILPTWKGTGKNRDGPAENGNAQAQKVHLDLHTAEVPISTDRLDLTIEELGLEERLVDGVLNLFAVIRKIPSKTHAKGSGKEGIYIANDSWTPSVEQSERGMAMFLSSLRVFVHLTGLETANEQLRDSVLHVLHLLTAFHPAVRTMHILLHGQTPTDQECAALAHAVYEILREIIPSNVIGFEESRVFEGARLFFGLLLEKSKTYKLREDDGLLFPYMTSMKNVALVNSETMEPIAFPVDTNVGLLERGCFDALKAKLIRFTDPELSTVTELPTDGRTHRAALLTGGVFSEVIMFDIDIVYSNYRYADGGDPDFIANPQEMKKMTHLAGLCSRHDLTIVPPARLGSAPHPVLTLDRDGLGAVYLGRQPCGDPGKDFLIFRPTRGGDCAVDIAIATQLLAPILKSRESDGTAIFDSTGELTERKLENPDEILMICVDCSASMGGSAGFFDVETDDEPAAESTPEPLPDGLGETNASSLDDIKEELAAYESFTDIVYTVKATPQHRQQIIAGNLLETLIETKMDELRNVLNRLENLRGRLLWTSRTARVEEDEKLAANMRKFLASLMLHKQALADFVVFRARHLFGSSSWSWKIGDPIPDHMNAEPVESKSEKLDLTVPHELLCPVTMELFQSPVIAADGKTYERGTIHKWFQIRKSSPLTGLSLEDTSLKPNRTITKNVREWVDGRDLLSNPEETRPKKRLSILSRFKTVKIHFVSRQGTFTRDVSEDLPLRVLYELAYRGLQGRYPNFNLLLSEATLEPNTETVTSTGIRSGAQVQIEILEASAASQSIQRQEGSPSKGSDSMCLVKVYSASKCMVFSYWTPINTEDTLACIPFKYYRSRAESSGLTEVDRKNIWMSLRSKGDGCLIGENMEPWERVSSYLTSTRATGILGEEPVFNNESASLNRSTPKTDEYEITGVSSPDNKPAPLVLKVLLHSKAKSRESKSTSATMSRLSVLKQMFDQFVNRVLAYDYMTHLGLITFESTATLAQPLTHVIEDFRSTVNRLNDHGDTALWDALALANDQLREYGERYPEAKKRILCISDGEDTNSDHRPDALCQDLTRNNVVVDSFCLGKEDNKRLRAVSFLTGGYKFAPQTLEEAMAICEMEPVLAQAERDMEDIRSSREKMLPRKSYTHISQLFNAATGCSPAEKVTKDVFPQRKEHPNLKDQFVELSAVSRRVLSADGRSDSRFRTSRLLTEAQSIAANPHPYYDVYVSESDMSFWKIVMQGPPESVYANGTFVLYIHMEENYPTFAPKARFVTPIYHPNVNRHGRICHSIFDRNWTSDTSNSMILGTIYGLLFEPDYSDPVNVVVTLDFHHDQVAFADIAKEYIEKHAKKTRAAWREEILGA